MTVEYKNAFAEVDYILGLASKDILINIPDHFLDFIKKQKTDNYKISFDEKLPLNEQPLRRETKAILSLIYRNYLCSAEQRKKYEIDDIIKLRKAQNELKQKYSYENLFKKNKKV